MYRNDPLFTPKILITLCLSFSIIFSFFNFFFLSFVFICLSLIFLKDFTSRIHEYEKVKKTFNSKGVTDLYLYSKRHSYCQRHLTISAAYLFSKFKGEYAEEFYYELGYRWYHLFPDNFHTVIFTKKFWKHTLFYKG